MSSLPGEFCRRSVPVPLPPRHAHADALTQRLGGPLIGGNRVELLEDGVATVAAMIRAIDGARDHVNIQSGIVRADGPGESIARHLADRCAEGVRVNLLFGGARSPTPVAPVLARLRRSGVSLCELGPAPRWRVLAGLSTAGCDHHRLMVVDGRIGFIGSADPQPAQRDLQVQVEGPVVQRLQRLFIAHWQRHAGGPMQQARYFRPLSPVGTHRVGVIADDAGGHRDACGGALLEAIDAAGQRVLLATTGHAPTRQLLKAAERGVEVALMLPGGAWPLPPAMQAQVTRLLQAGVHLHQHRGMQRDATACVVDGVWSGIGASPWGGGDRMNDAEVDLVVLDEAFGARLEALLRADAAAARPLDQAAWQRRSAWSRLRAAVVQRIETLF